jgi:MtN3 and saliva related transmembrane protein
MNLIEIIGYLAAFFTTISFIPQVIKVVKEKQTRNISLQMYLIFSLGITFWLIYGILINSLPIILANSLTLTFAIIILSYKIKYK